MVDANLLIYDVDTRGPRYQAASEWLQRMLNGNERFAVPWQSIGAFLRISTNPRISANPMPPDRAVAYVRAWMEAAVVWVPPTTSRTVAILEELLARHQVTGNLITDAQLAALAIEHGLEVYSMDSDFAQFPEVRWRNPLT